MVHSNVFVFTCLLRRMILMSYIQSFALSFDRYIQNRWVLITYPSTILISSDIPSPSSFGILVAFARGRGSFSFVG